MTNAQHLWQLRLGYPTLYHRHAGTSDSHDTSNDTGKKETQDCWLQGSQVSRNESDNHSIWCFVTLSRHTRHFSLMKKCSLSQKDALQNSVSASAWAFVALLQAICLSVSCLLSLVVPVKIKRVNKTSLVTRPSLASTLHLIPLKAKNTHLSKRVRWLTLFYCIRVPPIRVGQDRTSGLIFS